MGEKILVKRMREIADEIIEVYGSLKFFSLWKDEDNQLTYSLMVSAEWLDDKSPLEGISLISEILFKRMDNEELAFISRITPIHTSDKGRVEFFCMHVSNSDVHVINSIFNGFLVKDAYIFELH